MSTATVDTKREPGNATARATHFAFRHGVFNVKGGYFAFMRPTEEVGFYFPLGEMFGVTPIERIRNEFRLDPESDDAKLLLTVAQGLRHVREIRPGDSIPREILDGTASWSVEDKHHVLASNRLDLQVWSWIKGREQVIALPQNQQQVSGDPRSARRLPPATTRSPNALASATAATRRSNSSSSASGERSSTSRRCVTAMRSSGTLPPGSAATTGSTETSRASRATSAAPGP